MIYRRFRVSRFRGVDDVEVSLIKGDLVLLVGLNESGKTTILRGIEAFDHRNDPVDELATPFLRSVRNKSDLYSDESAAILAEIDLEEGLQIKKAIAGLGKMPDEHKSLVEAFLQEGKKKGHVEITRIFPFKNGRPQAPYYEFVSDHPLTQHKGLADRVAARIIELCPFIIYFEDFTDRIPERIFVTSSNDAFNPDWYDIIDGLFFNTSSDYSVAAFKSLHQSKPRRLDDANTVLKRVNKTLNKVFTKKWEELSGVSDIEQTELIYRTARSPYFEIKISDTDGTTYSVDERSKGALWYLSFLMKTEFRRKKIRKDSGKPVFLIDEPASNLHSTAQQNMLGDFRKLVEDTSVIYTTHSQYLISLENIRSAYIIRRKKGTVEAVLWADYLREEAPVISHYQPLANLLQLVPNNLDVPWPRAVITEGPSDKNILELLARVLGSSSRDYVIYPGTNAFNLGTLISLNLGWGADFRVLLDSDKAGKKAADLYKKEFGLDSSVVVLLPEAGRTMESYFTKSERASLFGIAFGRSVDKVSKKQFQNAMGVLNARPEHDKDVDAALSDDTKARFRVLLDALSFE